MTPTLYAFRLRAGAPKLNGRSAGTAAREQIRAWVAEVGVGTVRYLIYTKAFRLRVGQAMTYTVDPAKNFRGVNSSEYGDRRIGGKGRSITLAER